MAKILIKNGLLINRGKSIETDLLIKGQHIEKIGNDISDSNAQIIDAKERWIIPGIIDDQVHFREPGLTWKADIFSESRAALAGGVTSFLEMPNTFPPAITQSRLEEKYEIASKVSASNYSFYMGATNENLDEILKTDNKSVCGIKIFMGSSTGNMLVDDHKALEKIFSNAHMIIATHCEDEATIRQNMAAFKEKHASIDVSMHPLIRSREGCIKSSKLAIDLATRFGARLHILHISTKEETELFAKGPLENKLITAEACVHHMYFHDEDYHELGNKIKCNPAIKTRSDRDAIFQAMLDDRLDVIATDHAPHTIEEKSGDYLNAPSGLPLVQHSLLILLDYYHKGMISKEKIVEKMCHAPARLFEIEKRGYLDEDAYADIVIVDPNKEQVIDASNLRYRCNWSPLEGKKFKGEISHCFVNGKLKYFDGNIIDTCTGMRLGFLR